MKYLALFAMGLVAWTLMPHELDNVLRFIVLTIVVLYLLCARPRAVASVPQSTPGNPVARRRAKRVKKSVVTGPLSDSSGAVCMGPMMSDRCSPYPNSSATNVYVDLYGGRGMFM